MATVNRLKNKKKANDSMGEQAPESTGPMIPGSEKRTKIFSQGPSHTQQKQSEYEQYYEISQCNPIGVQPTSSLFPHNITMHSQYNLPLGFSISPMLCLENESEVMEKSADKIPRCGTCRAYMNCYNSFEKKNFNCFYCGRSNFLEGYKQSEQPNNELNSSIYQCLGPANFYPNSPPEDAFIFLIDITPEAAQCRMLYYAVAAIKEVLSRPEMDETVIYLYTYDDLIQEYDFSGEEIKCTIMDQSIDTQVGGINSNLLVDIRDKLFQLLDQLEEIAANNHRRGSNFGHSFSYLYKSLKFTSGKIFVFQANDSLIGEEWVMEDQPKGKNTSNPVTPPKSIIETKNKKFFDTYVSDMLNSTISIAFFIFARGYKNLKVFADTCKLTSSELAYYTKDSEPDLNKFYYDLSHLLGTTYFHDARIEFISCQGWHFTAVYGNFYRIKENITFKVTHLEPSKKLICMVSPAKSATEANPFCAIQVVINYRYKRQDFMCIVNVVQPVTGFLDRLYDSIDVQTTSAALSKGYLSSLRMENLNIARKKITEAGSQIYMSAMDHFKKKEKIPYSIISIQQSILSMLKSTHGQLDSISNSPIMDRVICERNFLQFAGCHELSNFFNPYLFNLTEMSETMCQEEEFSYPETIEAKFANVKQGIFLMDDGLSLFLFIGRKCPTNLIQELIGKPNLAKNDIITEDTINQNSSLLCYQIQNLVRTLREQKSFGWAPLYVVRCGENTLNERNFYLHFYGEKYDEFRSYKLTLDEFIAIVSKPGAF